MDIISKISLIMRVLFKTVIRNFIRRPVTNLINLFGLSISLTIVIILSIYTYSELTTDNFHENVNDVFLLKKNNNAIFTPAILAETIEGKIPGVKSIVRVTPAWETVVFQTDDKEPLVSDLVFADKKFFNLFSYRSIEGNLQYALNDPMTLVISESLSKKLFGSQSALGRLVKYNDNKIFTVTAVFKEQEKNTCFRFNSVTSIESLNILQPEPGQFTEWGNNSFQTFLYLEKDQNQDNIIRSLIQFVPERINKRENYSYSKAGLIPLPEIYFSKLWVFNNYMVFGNKKKTVTLLMVAILVLMIALVNFKIISTAQWRERIKQFGVMKVLGATGLLIAREVMTESFIFFLTAFFIAAQLSSTISPVIRNYTGIIFNDRINGSFGFIILSVLSVFILSVLISIFPSIRISSSKSIDNLKKTYLKEKTRYSLNGVLVTIQFTVAIALISFTILVQKQVSFGTSTLGINQDNILGIKLTPQLFGKRDVLRTSLEKEPLIDKISFSQYYPGKEISNWGVEMKLLGEEKMVFFDTFCADKNFFPLMGLELVSGRLYSDSLSTDRDKVIVNESFLKKYNIADPLGLTFNTFHGTKAEIIGMIRDFHYKPINTEIVPLVIRNEAYYSYCTVHFTSNDFNSLNNAISSIKKIVADISPSYPVEVTFMDNAIQNLYNSELMFRRAFLLLAACALLICCLGILAMSISVCQKRVKEIGIRRVNGAKAYEILLMLNRNMVKWVLVAFIISAPISWYFMHLWLRSYAYKTPISWWIFAIAGLGALIIALITVSWRSWRASTRNPVEALRYE
jgi:putative ABC transport system permease protein